MEDTDKPDGREEPSIIICGSAPHIEGSNQRTCSRCEAVIYIAPSGVQVQERTKADLVCFECGVAVMKEEKEKGEEIKLMPPQPEQKKEIVEELRRLFKREVQKRDGNGASWLKL